MLPLGTAHDRNFLSPQIFDAVCERIDGGDHSGIIATDRLYRNLLSSQPACFNLFGPFVSDPAALLPWITSLDSEATAVRAVRFEWAPPRQEHFDGGSAFDAFIEYSAGSLVRFFGVECKYAENLAASGIKVKQAYIDFTSRAHGWREGAASRLDVPMLKQFWLNTLLAQSLDEKDSHYDRGAVVIVACAQDQAAREATAGVQAELVDPDTCCWSPYEEIIATVESPLHAAWASQFRERYLDFTPVRDLLKPSDPRL
jgi:hypothetical protein